MGKTDQIVWVDCERCEGDGQLFNPISQSSITCSDCGGHGQIPAGGQGSASYHNCADNSHELRVAILHRDQHDGSRWRVTKFDQDGPMYHYTLDAEKIMGELRNYRQSDTAGWLLDQWAKRPRWSEGCQRAELAAMINLFSAKGRADLAHDVCTDDLDRSLELAHAAKSEHFPQADLY